MYDRTFIQIPSQGLKGRGLECETSIKILYFVFAYNTEYMMPLIFFKLRPLISFKNIIRYHLFCCDLFIF
jgi:hypothetical protein